jgi:hypothetical protein
MRTAAMRTIAEVLDDKSTSFWLRSALASAITRDPIDAFNDAEVLVELLRDNAGLV